MAKSADEQSKLARLFGLWAKEDVEREIAFMECYANVNSQEYTHTADGYMMTIRVEKVG
jgi:hypothetical protein